MVGRMRIPDKGLDSIIDGMDMIWTDPHGPPQELMMDSETAVYRGSKSQQCFQRKGIKYEPRAKGQQIAHVDRRLALQKQAIHKTVDQLKAEGITMPFKHILSETNVAGNCLITVNNMSPYMALYGSVPALLPGISQSNAEQEDLQVSPGTIRWTFRLREISTAAQRL
jgi:hypothetical protein